MRPPFADPQRPPSGYASLFEAAEHAASPETPDPVGEASLSPVPFLIRKYSDRALFLAAASCFSDCPFCFRRGSPLLNGKNPSEEDAAGAARWVAEHPEISEVIISGGDPLTLTNEKLAKVISTFASVSGIRRIRIHTKAPLVSPSRVDLGLQRLLVESAVPVSVVLNLVHPEELAPSVLLSLETLKEAGVPLSCQTVLLKGVNDDANLLAELFSLTRKLKLPPRYLHHPDRAPGTEKFWLPMAKGLDIVRGLAKISGCETPPYVVDLPDGSGKTRVDALKIVGREEGGSGIRLKYRWERPEGWPGVRLARECEWWDVADSLGNGL